MAGENAAYWLLQRVVPACDMTTHAEVCYQLFVCAP